MNKEGTWILAVCDSGVSVSRGGFLEVNLAVCDSGVSVFSIQKNK